MILSKMAFVKTSGKEEAPNDSDISRFIGALFCFNPREYEDWVQQAVIWVFVPAPRHSAIPGYQYN